MLQWLFARKPGETKRLFRIRAEDGKTFSLCCNAAVTSLTRLGAGAVDAVGCFPVTINVEAIQ